MLRPHRLRFCFGLLAIAAAQLSAGETTALPDSTTRSVERPTLPSRSETMAADLVRQLPAAEVVGLQAAEEAFVALWRPANVAEPKGVVILLPGEGESADWPIGIGPLRRGLPDHGWHTLSVSLPESPGFPLPLAPEPEPEPEQPLPEREPSESTADSAEQPEAPNEAGYLPEETMAPSEEPPSETAETEVVEAPVIESGKGLQVSERIDERIEAALTYARTRQPEMIVLLGQGTGGYWAARYLRQLAPEDIQHLLLIQPRQPQGQEEPLTQLAPALKLATGDFYYKSSIGQQNEARERLNASRRNQHPAYHQVGLQFLPDNQTTEQQRLLRRVRGWLDKQL